MSKHPINSLLNYNDSPPYIRNYYELYDEILGKNIKKVVERESIFIRGNDHLLVNNNWQVHI